MEDKCEHTRNAGGKMTTIGLVRRGYSPTGGAEAALRRFAAAARALGHTCVLFSDRDWPDFDGPQVRVQGKDPRAFADAVEAARPWERCGKVLSFERVWRCDLYRAGDGVHAAWMERRSAVEPGWKSWWRALEGKHGAILELERKLLNERGARIVVANSQMVADEVQRYYPGCPTDRIHVIYNGAPEKACTAETRAATRARLGIDPHRFVALFVGSGDFRKGLSVAIQAVHDARLGAPLLLVAGRAASRYRSDGRVRMLGPRKDVPDLLSAADCFILPTLYDPFSNATLEALIAGVPAITTTANGCAEWIDSETGTIISNPRDVAAFAGALEDWSKPTRRSDAQSGLHKLGERSSLETNAQRILDLLLQ